MTPEVHQWLEEFLNDVLSETFLGDYLRQLVGPIPYGVIREFGLDYETMTELFGVPT